MIKLDWPILPSHTDPKFRSPGSHEEKHHRPPPREELSFQSVRSQTRSLLAYLISPPELFTVFDRIVLIALRFILISVRSGSNMGFLVTTLIFVVVGVIASLCARICCNKGPATNLLHLTLVITATVCCWMMWAIVYIAQMNPLIVPILSEVEK